MGRILVGPVEGPAGLVIEPDVVQEFFSRSAADVKTPRQIISREIFANQSCT